MAQRIRVKVHGMVQGVGFRFATAREAERLGVTGWVKNLLDGTVEAELIADPDTMKSMTVWLTHGPRTASVTRVEVLDHGFGEPGEGFRIA